MERLTFSSVKLPTLRRFSWTFVRAEVSDFEAEKPRLDVISSPEYSEKGDAATIAKILKSIVSRRSA